MGHMQDQGEDRGDVGGDFPAQRVVQEKNMKK